jgi:hypothetical protein
MIPQTPKPTKSFVWPLLLAIGFSLPQVVSWNDALREATDYGSDWVVISGALFVAAGVCLVLSGYRLLKWGGAGVALVVIAGVGGWAYVTLEAHMQERREHRARYQAKEDAYPQMVAVCRDGAPLAAAAAYDPQRSGLHPMVTFELPPSRVESSYQAADPRTPSYRKPLTDWLPDALEQVELVACVQPGERRIETCEYVGGVLHRVQHTLVLRVFALATGELVLEESREGSMPPECKMVEEFYGESTTTTRGGSSPSVDELVELLRPLAVVP